MVEGHSKDSFVARIWLEHGNNGDTTWRGHIRHVQGDAEEYFQNLMEMREFLSQVSGINGPPLTAQSPEEATKSTPGTVANIKQKSKSEI
jgi:hypothetical protein